MNSYLTKDSAQNHYINKYLGFNVDAYYQIGDNASGNELKVLYMEQDEKSEEVTVYADDIISYENGSFEEFIAQMLSCEIKFDNECLRRELSESGVIETG